MLSSEFKNSHWCFKERQNASIIELDSVTSTWARTRRRDSAEQSGVDGGVDVLDARVGHDGDRWSRDGVVEMSTSGDEHLAGCGGIEAPSDGPSQDLPREVVDDGVDVGFGAVEQFEDGDIHVPDFVRGGGPNSDGRFGGMNAKARAAPAPITNEACPGGGGGEDPADALGVEAQGAEGHVPAVGGEDHIFDSSDLDGGELTGCGSRTRGAIVEAANHSDAPPGVVARGGQAEDPQGEREGQGGHGAGDSAQDAGFGLAVWETLARETEAGGSNKGEEKADGRCQDPYASIQLLDGAQELLAVLAEDINADNGAQATTLPTGDGRARDVQSVADRSGTGTAHLLSDSVVVRAAELDRWKGRRHRRRIAESVRWASERPSKSSVIFSMAHLRTGLFGMSWRSARSGTNPKVLGCR